MPELEYFVVAESHSIDRDTGAISIFNVFSEMKCDAFPFALPNMILISAWVSSEKEISDQTDAQMGIKFNLPNGKSEGPYNVNFSSGTQFQNVILGYNGLTVPSPGMMEIELLLNGQHTAKHRISFLESDVSGA